MISLKIICEKEKHVSYSTICKIDKSYCCKKMKRVFNKNYKNSYNDGSGKWWNAFELDECGISIPIRENYNGVQCRERISFCPFCGEEIE